MRKNIEIIPAKPIKELRGLEPTAKTRVCAYCRVSTDNDDQLSSLEAQIGYYSATISNHPEWEFVGIYADEGISGTNTKKRTALAQEESNNLSRVTRMGIVYRFQEGKVKVNHNRFIGYTKDEKGELVIVPEEAKVVQRIYKEFLERKSTYKIASGLQSDEILTGAGNKKWWDSTVEKILRNEKYMGDALLQKSYTVDFLTKKRVKNDGYVQKYYVEDSHQPIISKEEFAAVQKEFARRSSMRGYSKTGKSAFTSEYPFSGKLFCQNCGSKFRRHVWGKGKNRKYMWQCINRELNGTDGCSTKPVKEKDLELAFLRAMNKVIEGKETFMKTLMENIYRGLENPEREYSSEQIDDRLKELQQDLMSLVRLNAKTGLDTGVYDQQYSTLAAEIELMRERMERLKGAEAQRVLRVNRVKEIEEYLAEQGSPLDKFDGDLFRRLIEKVKVQPWSRLCLCLKRGLKCGKFYDK